MHPVGSLVVLHCGDTDSEAHSVARLLRQSRSAIDFRHVSTRSGFVAALNEVRVDIVLCEFVLTDFDSSDAVRLVRTRSATLPFLFLSSTVGEDYATESLRLGATDYVPKERLDRLGVVVERALRDAATWRHSEAAALELTEHRRLLAGVLAALPDFVYAVDRDNRLVACNARASETLFGSVADVIPNALLRDLNPPGIDVAAMVAENSNLMEQGLELRDEERLRIDVEGGERRLQVSKTLLRDGEATHGLVVVARDITDRLLLERAVLEVSEQEQRRIGGDLHDGLGQELAALRLLLTALEQSIPAAATDAHERLRRAQSVLRGAIVTTGRLARGLAPVDLEQASLSSALATLVERSTAMFGVECRFDDRGGETLAHLDTGAVTHLYRIAQEAVGNAARHGTATIIEVTLGAAPDLYIEVRDNGNGFDAGASEDSPGMGLRLMKYRAHLIGGVVTIASGPGGTIVRCQCKPFRPKKSGAGRRRPARIGPAHSERPSSGARGDAQDRQSGPDRNATGQVRALPPESDER